MRFKEGDPVSEAKLKRWLARQERKDAFCHRNFGHGCATMYGVLAIFAGGMFLGLYIASLGRFGWEFEMFTGALPMIVLPVWFGLTVMSAAPPRDWTYIPPEKR